jgi:predicted permease
VRLGVRTCLRRPGVSLLVTGILGVGLGASSTAFDALDRTVLRPMPFAGADRLVFLVIDDLKRDSWTTPSLELVANWRSRARRLERIEILDESLLTLQHPEGAERVEAISVSGGLPEMLGTLPLSGRLLGPHDAQPDAPAAVMITEQAWRTRFGADPGIVGRALPFSGGPRTVVGIWPDGARISFRRNPEFIVPLPHGREYGPGDLAYVLARQAVRSTPADVEAELRALSAGISGIAENKAPAVKTPAETFLGASFVEGVWLVFAGALGLLSVALVNASHLLLGRATTRMHELGVRMALGGSRARLARLFLAEGVVLVGAGIAAGVWVLVACEQIIRHREPRLFVPVQGAGLEGRAFAFMAAAAVVAVVLCALAPLLSTRNPDIRQIVQRGADGRTTPGGSRALPGFVFAQAALAVLLICGAAVLGRSAWNLVHVDPGIAVDQLATVGVAAPSTRYRSADAQRAFLQRVSEALASMPTVNGITVSGLPLLSSSSQVGSAYLEGESKPAVDDDAVTGLASVAPNYFAVLGMRIVAGRGFTPDDDTGVAIVNESFAARRAGDVLGRLVYTPMGQQAFRIVGVVTDTRSFGLANDTNPPAIFFPRSVAPTGYARFLVRTSDDPEAILREARRRIAEIDPLVPVTEAEAGHQVLKRQTAMHRLVAMLLGGLATGGLVLAVTGVYGTVALAVERRRREFGIRLALGADRARLRRAVVGIGVRPVLAGGLLGVAMAWMGLPYVEALLFRVSARDPIAALLGFSVVAVAAVAAAALPARRASRVDPAEILRSA